MSWQCWKPLSQCIIRKILSSRRNNSETSLKTFALTVVKMKQRPDNERTDYKTNNIARSRWKIFVAEKYLLVSGLIHTKSTLSFTVTGTSYTGNGCEIKLLKHMGLLAKRVNQLRYCKKISKQCIVLGEISYLNW